MRFWILTAVLLAMPLASQAQSYRCTGKDGKRYYGATIPNQCVGQMVEQLNAQGTVMRRIEPAMTAEQRAEREAEKKAAAEKAAQEREEGRRNRALLATYQSDEDIEIARKRALEDNERSVKEVEVRIDQLRKRDEGFKKEMEFYQGKNKPPARFEQDVARNRQDLKIQEEELARRKEEAKGINARFDEDKRRFQELTKAAGGGNTAAKGK
jgi:hypothetical protein